MYPLTHQGIYAEMIAATWGIPREELDAFSLRSHQRAAAATDAGYFDRELMSVSLADGSRFTHDEGIRRDTTLEKLAALQPSFKPDGVITAGNSSQISDGAAAVLLMTPEKAAELGLRPRARIVAQKVVGVDPVMMLTGPIPATQQILAKSGLTMADIDLFEVNEAFAPVVLAWKRELDPDMERVNVNGGAIALGHPLGCSGARLMTTLLHELERREARYGLQTMCCGGGLGTATIIERL
jgi:acetyl-CoA acetyltransferase family protein